MKTLNLATIASVMFFLAILFAGFVSPNRTLGPGHAEEIKKDSVYEQYVQNLYQTIGLADRGLSRDLFEKGLTGFYNIKNKRALKVKDVLTIVDFGKRSKEKRLWVIDLEASKILFNTLVAHGKNTGEDLALKFSDTPNSNMSSLGFYLTENTYCGKHGLSLRLEGLDKGYNSNAKERAIVMHGASYVCEDFIDSYGRLGRSQGCPALPVSENEKIIDVIKDGSVLFMHHPASPYQSVFLDRKIAAYQIEVEKGS